MVSEYERIRLANIKRNKELLKSLDLESTFVTEVKRPKAKSTAKKRKTLPSDGRDEEPVSKAPRTGSDNAEDTGSRRRSQRNVGRKVDYKSEQIRQPSVPASVKSGIRNEEETGPLGREGGKRLHDPKVFGPIPGIAVGTWWESREGCSADAIHAPWVAGISGGKDGAYSVALSGGYEDDVDLGSAFTYTGSGGRDLKGTKNAPKNLRTAPQSCDQDFEHSFNKALKRSSETKKPVRVIRGYKLKSKFAPSEGYRYDGLYRVERAWMEQGLEGFMVCKFAFKRLDGQPPLMVRASDANPVGVTSRGDDIQPTVDEPTDQGNGETAAGGSGGC